MSTDHNACPSYAISKQDRQRLHGHRSCIVWFTGLSGAGKSTIADAVEQRLHSTDVSSYILDGDHMRHGLSRGLGFSREDRSENIRRAGETAKLFVDSGILVIATFISPYRANRDYVRGLVEPGEFIEVYVQCPLDCCESRDPKGLYRRARRGEIESFTGISDPYEEPLCPEIVLRSDQYSVEQCAEQVISYLSARKYLSIPSS